MITLPKASVALTVKLKAVPAVGFVGKPLTTKLGECGRLDGDAGFLYRSGCPVESDAVID